MLRSSVALAFAFSLMTGFAAQAQTGPSEDAVKEDKKICKVSGVTGSRLNKTRTCRTAKEWDDIERVNKENAAKMTDMKGATNGQTGAAATMGSNQ
ncbi:MAG: hypothetical protein JNM81_03805 [Rhodospirillaceae bacterium]|nr:hypothetical protein [Rhodospirillaceae bacterium]